MFLRNIMGYSVSQSLISGQPPLLVFTICLTAFGLSMVILAYVVGEQDVPNPDVQMDWNKFFKKISYLKLCTFQNDTRPTNDGVMQKKGSFKSIVDSALNSSNSHIVDKSISAVLSDVVDGASEDDPNNFALVNIAVKVQFGLHGKLPSDSMYMKGNVNGKLLGFSGKYSSLLFNISLSFRPLHNSSCDGAKCHSLYEACLIMSLPANLLPETKSPERCKAGDYIEQEAQPVYFSETEILSQKDASAVCVELDYTPDAKLTEMLSLQDRSIVNLHLMHTSYFMFVMVMTLVCYSLIKGRYRHPKNSLSLEKIPLDA